MTVRHLGATASAPMASAVSAGARPRSVLFVCLAAGIGGSTRSLATVLQYLGPRVRRILATPASGGAFLSLVQARGAVDELLLLPQPSGRLGRLARIMAATTIARYVRAHRAELSAIHANGPEELNIAGPAAWFARIPLVVWSHARSVSPWMRRLAPIWKRLLSGQDVRWAAVSADARAVLVAAGLAGKEEVAIIPNPIDPSDVAARRRNGRGGPIIVGYLGSDAPYKGFQFLPEVIERLCDIPVRWLVFSSPRSPSNRGAWERLASFPDGIVRIAGRVPEVREAYARCDVVFCPSLEESFCRVAAEAMANGLPVVASDLPAVRTLVGDEQAGLLFPPGDAEAAARCIHRLVSDRELARRLGAAGRIRSRRYRPAQIVAKLARAYGLETWGM